MRNLKNKLGKTSGFTLVEMLIVVAIIAILIAVSIPLVSQALEKARDATDQANERSAKAEATLVYMGVTDDFGELDFSTDTFKGYVYNATEGKLVAVATGADYGAAYGKCTAASVAALNAGTSECGATGTEFAAKNGNTGGATHVDKHLLVYIYSTGEIQLIWNKMS